MSNTNTASQKATTKRSRQTGSPGFPFSALGEPDSATPDPGDTSTSDFTKAHINAINGLEATANHTFELGRLRLPSTKGTVPLRTAKAKYRTLANLELVDDGPEPFFDEGVADLSDADFDNVSEDDEGFHESSDEEREELSDRVSEQQTTLTVLPQANTVSFQVERWTPIDDRRLTRVRKPTDRKEKIPEDLESGDIITLCAALKPHGWTKEDEIRWYLVLGQLPDEHWVIVPITTLGGRGKWGMKQWKRGYFKNIEQAPSPFPDDRSDHSSEDDPDEILYNPWQSVFSDNYECRRGSILPLATAFIIDLDAAGTSPPRFNGGLTVDSFDDFWRCHLHLKHFHPEFVYLISKNPKDWDLEIIVSRNSSVTALRRIDPNLADLGLFAGLTQSARMETFENIYLDLSKQSGRCRLAESGLGWKPSGGSDPFTLDNNQIAAAQWSRASKGYEIKIITRDASVIQLDGFEQEDFDRAAKAFKIWYGINLESKEHALRGWNWGKAEFGRAELAFNVQNRPAFEIPYSEIANTNLAGKNEIAVEFNLGNEPAQNGTNGHAAGSTKNRGRKAAAGRDELVEMRFYIPGTVSKKEVNGDEDASGAEDEEVDEQNAANLFYETLMDKADIGEVAGATFATFQDILHLTPRGRFDIDMYENSFRLRGKTYDYKIQYQSIKKFFILPKNDEVHTLITLGLDPPLRQGQTRYPFIVMQLKLDEEVNLDLNMTEELLETKYKDKLDSHYEAPIHHVIAKVFKGLSGKKIIMPSKDFVSHHNMNGVKCSIKANEGLLFCLDKSFMFVPKPATYVQIESIASITMSRVGGALAASRTFDITITLKNGQGEHQFSNINREEQQPLEAFFQAKGIRFKNEMLDDSSTLLKAALNDQDLASSDDEEAGANRGSADEDDESPDEDFQADSDSDVAEEYDSAHESSGSDASDAEMQDADDDDDGGDVDAAASDDEDSRPKKKAKK